MTASAYARDVSFEDPITPRLSDLASYQLMVRAIKTLFRVSFDLHDVSVTAPDTITTR